ncbi:hypothetical protein [Rubidibacter lacunae]|uniref:hypothetical protein n=1 Tax=Rubidibacter lacunae TaxID=582514 RepID=UPI0012EB47B7|nr:hypothetical protein [Rubidibacter lacunae]
MTVRAIRRGTASSGTLLPEFRHGRESSKQRDRLADEPSQPNIAPELQLSRSSGRTV